MHMLERVIRVFAPHTCLGCGIEEDLLLCEGCQEAIPPVPSRCYLCGATTDQYATCRECALKTPLEHVIVFAGYQGLTKKLVRQTKYERARAGAAEMAALLIRGTALQDVADDIVLVPVPTATSRVRARGYDQAVLLSTELARRLERLQKRFLSRVGQAHQVGANRNERKRQLQGAFRAVQAELVKGRHILLVDDVLTTGATLETAARVLLRAGAVRVDAVVFAQA